MRNTTWFAPAVASALVLAACHAETATEPAAAPATTVAERAAEPTEPTPEATEMTTEVAAAPEPMEMTAEVTEMTADAPPTTADVPASEVDASTEQVPDGATQRCLDTATIIDQRIEAEGFEFPEDEDELSEEELAQTLRPAFDVDDSVASPDERPDLAPMAEFDPTSAPILELDLLVEACYEAGIITDADFEELEDGAQDADVEFAAWCDELAAYPIEEVREFAADEGTDVVAEEFEACQLPNPLA